MRSGPICWRLCKRRHEASARLSWSSCRICLRGRGDPVARLFPQPHAACVARVPCSLASRPHRHPPGARYHYHQPPCGHALAVAARRRLLFRLLPVTRVTRFTASGAGAGVRGRRRPCRMKCVDRYGSVRTYTAVSAAVVKYYYSQSRARACRGRQKGRAKGHRGARFHWFHRRHDSAVIRLETRHEPRPRPRAPPPPGVWASACVALAVARARPNESSATRPPAGRGLGPGDD